MWPFPPTAGLPFGAADHFVLLWDLSTGRELRCLDAHTGPVRSVAISPDGTRVLSGGEDGTVRLWDLAAGQELRCFTGHSHYVLSVAFTPNGRYALSGSAVVVGGAFAIITFVLGIPVVLIVLISAISGAAAMVNGVLIILGRIKVEDLDSGLLSGLMTDSTIGVIAWVAIAVVAALYQLRGVGDAVTAINRSAYRY